jgi:hypothetical protein
MAFFTACYYDIEVVTIRNIKKSYYGKKSAASVKLRNNSVYSVYPPILCIRLRVGLNSLARILLIIPSGFFFIHSRI